MIKDYAEQKIHRSLLKNVDSSTYVEHLFIVTPKEETESVAQASSKMPFTLTDLKDVQELDEVVVKTNYQKTNLKKFQESSFNVVDVFDFF